MDSIESVMSTHLEDLRKLNSFIKEEVELQLSKAKDAPYSSQETAELNAALAKAQAEYKNVEFNRVNPYLDLNYTDLCNLIKATRPALTKYGLAVLFQIRTPSDGSTVLHTIMLHNSGQWIETRARIIPPKNDVAAYESALNSQKRFSYMALACISPTNDPGDDDGEVAMIKSNEYIAHGPSEKNNPKRQSSNVVAKHQLEELEKQLRDFPELAENLLERMSIQSLADLPASQYDSTIIRIRKIKEEINNRGGDRTGKTSSFL